MIVLSSVSDKIQISLASSVTTNQVQCVACWRDITSTPTYTAGRSATNTNNTVDVDVVSSPAASTQRVIDFINVFNADTASTTASVKLSSSGLSYMLWKGSLEQGERLEYENGKGWTVSNASGVVKYVGATGASGANGSNGALSVTEVEVDFGATPVFEKQITVIDAGVSASSKIIASQSGKAATGKQSDENEMDFLILNCTPGSGQFTLNCRAIPGPVSGLQKINYQFS